MNKTSYLWIMMSNVPCTNSTTPVYRRSGWGRFSGSTTLIGSGGSFLSVDETDRLQNFDNFGFYYFLFILGNIWQLVTFFILKCLHRVFQNYTIITTRVRSTREGNVFSLFVRPHGGGLPSPPTRTGYSLPCPSPAKIGTRYHHPVPGPCSTPGKTRKGYPAPSQTGNATDKIWCGQYVSCVFTQDHFLVS